MSLLRVGRWFGLGILVCSYALGPAPGGNAQVKSLDQLIKQLEDPNPDVRLHAVNALGGRKDRRVVEPLITVLKDADYAVRNDAAYALGMTGEPAVQPLIGALIDRSPAVRRGAAVALGYIEDPRLVGH